MLCLRAVTRNFPGIFENKTRSVNVGMSDSLNIHEQLKFKSKISFTSEGCLNYIRRNDSKEVLITLIIPVEILVKWHKIKTEKKFSVSFVDLLNLSNSLPSCCFKLKQEATERIERRLKELCCLAAKSCIGISGNNRVKQLQKVKKLAILRTDVEDVNELLRKITSFEDEKAELQEQVVSLEAKCESLVQDVLKLTQDKHRITESEHTLENLQDENKELLAYVQALVDRDCCKNCDSSMANKGNTYNEVSYTQKQRKLKELKTNAERALWFMESYGFEINSLSLTALDGEKVNIEYNSSQKSGYQFLPPKDQDLIKSVVYIMDKFCVSDAAYHELSMVDREGLPRSYLIKQCRHSLNELCCITRTPGEWPGAQLSFITELKHQLSKQVSTYICKTRLI